MNKQLSTRAVSHMVRGYGPFDGFLARQRYKAAKRQIAPAKKKGRILDIGSGLYPQFLLSVDFMEKYGLDKNAESDFNDEISNQKISLVKFDIEKEGDFPFEDNFFDVVTMLAVFEHIEPGKLKGVHRQIRRVLKPGGIYIMTTPACWTDGLLKVLARLGLISDVEIKEHKGSYGRGAIYEVFGQCGFEEDQLKYGHFLFFMNTWATAVK